MIAIQVPVALRDCCRGAAELSLSASTVRAALEQLKQIHPQLYCSVCDETGRVRRHVNLFINSAVVRDERELDAALATGDVITIFQAVSGG